jgi:2,3-diaminopropionate biosynthesis protein SbnB
MWSRKSQYLIKRKYTIMRYVNETHLEQLGIDWQESIEAIRLAVNCLLQKDYAQPVKPYLRYGNIRNRIIAMPAFIGGDFYMAGIKWIASFPDNINKGLPRAHSVVILNEAATGKPVAIFNTGLLSVIRTASVSGVVMQKYLGSTSQKKFRMGMTGWGPIGQYHYQMAKALLGSRLEYCYIYDPREDRQQLMPHDETIRVASTWQEAYEEADIFITCTVSAAPYIDLPPKINSLHMNVSLRDYKPQMYHYFKGNIIVDDWTEISRENTDIEVMHLQQGLQEAETLSLAEVVTDWSVVKKDRAVFFNPMGMAVLDIALATLYYEKATDLSIGLAI